MFAEKSAVDDADAVKSPEPMVRRESGELVPIPMLPFWFAFPM